MAGCGSVGLGGQMHAYPARLQLLLASLETIEVQQAPADVRAGAGAGTVQVLMLVLVLSLVLPLMLVLVCYTDTPPAAHPPLPRCAPPAALLQQLIDGCSAALTAYPTSIDEDLAMINR